jgi:hypothetical protein
VIPADKVNVLPMMKFASDALTGQSYIRPNKVLPFFDLANAMFTPIGPKMYYQIANSKEGAGDVSNCTTTTAACIAAAISTEKQEVIKEITSQFMPDGLVSVIEKVFDVQRTSTESGTTATSAQSSTSESSGSSSPAGNPT